MTVSEFKREIAVSKARDNDKKWFPKWIERYESFLKAKGETLPITEQGVIAFCRELLENGAPAWQRCRGSAG